MYIFRYVDIIDSGEFFNLVYYVGMIGISESFLVPLTM